MAEPEYVPLNVAAKLAHRRVTTLREMVEREELAAFRRDRRGIYIRRSDALALAKRFTPFVPAKARRRPRRQKLHPAVKV